MKLAAICARNACTLELCTRCIILIVILSLVRGALGATVVYFPFETGDSLTPTPDLSGGSGKDATLEAGTSITNGGGMFGNALNTTDSPTKLSAATVADGIPDIDKQYADFTLSLWIKPNVWNTTTSAAITGKMGTSSSQRGWYLEKQPSNTAVAGTNNDTSQLLFAFWPTGSNTTPPNDSLQTRFTAPLSTDDYIHVAVTFTANQHASLYINGILDTDVNTTANTAATINGANNRGFEIGNRGSLNVPGFIGNIDDYVLKDDMISAQQVALIHGLGRLGGVAYGSGGMPGADIDAVLNAFNTQSSAVVGGETWTYLANLNQGTIVGASGGSVSGGDAYIVLGADGSGVVLQSAPPGLAGDFDGDGDVDGADFVAWQTNFPTASGATQAMGDADGDGDVDGADFATWQGQFPTAPSPTLSVPEPAELYLIVFGIIGVAGQLRRSKSSE